MANGSVGSGSIVTGFPIAWLGSETYPVCCWVPMLYISVWTEFVVWPGYSVTWEKGCKIVIYDRIWSSWGGPVRLTEREIQLLAN